ncbi:MAG: biopolymer transporter ExbD [Polyangiales bacterium]
MAGNSNPNRGSISGINITPLVDIVLVLLVVFIVTAKIVVTPAIPVDLPQASNGEDVAAVFSVLLLKDGSLLLNGATVANRTLLLEKAHEASDQSRSARRDPSGWFPLPHRDVIGVMDVLRNAGLTRLAFGVLPEDGESR